MDKKGKMSDTLQSSHSCKSQSSRCKRNYCKACKSFSNDCRRKKNFQKVTKRLLKPATFHYNTKAASFPSSLLKQLDDLSLDTAPVNTTISSQVNDNESSKKRMSMGNLKKLNMLKESCSKSFDGVNCASKQEIQCNHCATVENNVVAQCKSSLSTEHKSSSKHFRKCYKKRKHRKVKTSLKLKLDLRLSNIKPASAKTHANISIQRGCGYQVYTSETNAAVNELAAYMENYFFLPKKMSSMAEMMYT